MPAGGVFPADWSRDGTQLMVSREDLQGRPRTLLMIPADGGAAKVVVDGESFLLNLHRLSPGADRIAFTSLATGTAEIYVISSMASAGFACRATAARARGGARPIAICTI